MSGPITVQISSNAQEVVRRLQQLPAAMLQAIARTLDLQNELTVGHVQATKLRMRGPDTLGVVSHRLWESVRPSAAVINGQAIESAIGSNVRYAGVHEFGFTGTEQVRAYTRRVTSAFGRKLKSATTASVGSHSRKANVRARRWLSRGIEERMPAYGKAISAAIVGAWEGSS